MKPTDADRDPAFDRLIARGLEGETDVTGNACPDADLLAAWYDHSLAASEAERIQAHAATCGVCQQILADLARSEPAVVRAAPVPEPSKPWHWHWRWLVPVATMLVVVIVVGNRTLRAPEPNRQAAEAGRLKLEEAARATQAQQVPAEAAPASQPPAAAPTETPKSERPSTLARKAAPADAAVPGGVQHRLQVAPLPSEVRADRAEPLAENRVAPLTRQVSESTSGGVVGGVALAVPPAPAAPPPPPAAGFVTPLKPVAMKAVAPPLPSVALSPGGKVAWRVGAAGKIERSTEGRGSWQTQSSGVTDHLFAASATSESNCWAVGAAGLVLRTTDGVTWTRVSSPADADLLFVRATAPDAAIVRAADGSEYSTSDGGRTWTKRQ